MTVDERIERAIERGQRDGLRALDGTERMIFLIAELEADCIKDGIDAFISRYDSRVLSEAAHAFDAIGATAIAEALRRIVAALPTAPELLLNSANDLISSGVGYSHASIAAAVERMSTPDA